MAQKHPSNKLTALSVKKLNKTGWHADGNGLYLVIESSGAKRWMQRLVVQGRRRDIGLGSVNIVSLDDARETALCFAVSLALAVIQLLNAVKLLEAPSHLKRPLSRYIA